MNKVLLAFGAACAVARGRMGLTREAASAMCAISEETYVQIEEGTALLTWGMLIQIAEALHVRADDLDVMVKHQGREV